AALRVVQSRSLRDVCVVGSQPTFFIAATALAFTGLDGWEPALNASTFPAQWMTAPEIPGSPFSHAFRLRLSGWWGRHSCLPRQRQTGMSAPPTGHHPPDHVSGFHLCQKGRATVPTAGIPWRSGLRLTAQALNRAACHILPLMTLPTNVP